MNKYKQSGYDGLKCLKRGRPRNEESSMITNNNNKPKELSKSEREELIALKRRNEYLEAENAYLKKSKPWLFKRRHQSRRKSSRHPRPCQRRT